jgi:hypothetical protein
MRFAPTGSPSHLSLRDRRICLPVGPHAWPGTTTARDALPSCVTPSLTYYPLRSPALSRIARRQPPPRAGLVSRASALAVHVGYGNINPLSIDYACRPRLRPRLTLGGTAWPRNPWSIGANDSHVGYRYSCLHSHSRALHPWLTPGLHRTRDAPLPNTHPAPHGLPPGGGAPFGARC